MENYHLFHQIGKGTYAVVFKGIHKQTQQRVAIKRLMSNHLSPQVDMENKPINSSFVSQEVEILKKLQKTRHPAIVHLHEVFYSPTLCIVLEYVGSQTLLDFVNEHGRMSEKNAFKIWSKLLSGVEYLHNSGIVHRDIKAENILFRNISLEKRRTSATFSPLKLTQEFDKTQPGFSATQNRRNSITAGNSEEFEKEERQGPINFNEIEPVLCDFGFASYWSPNAQLKTFCGSLMYASPEIVCRKPYFGPEADIWSLGIALYGMIAGTLPFQGTKQNIIAAIELAQYEFPLHFSDLLCYFIEMILEPDRSNRPTPADLRIHPWFIHQATSISPTGSSSLDSSAHTGLGVGGNSSCMTISSRSMSSSTTSSRSSRLSRRSNKALKVSRLECSTAVENFDSLRTEIQKTVREQQEWEHKLDQFMDHKNKEQRRSNQLVDDVDDPQFNHFDGDSNLFENRKRVHIPDLRVEVDLTTDQQQTNSENLPSNQSPFSGNKWPSMMKRSFSPNKDTTTTTTTTNPTTTNANRPPSISITDHQNAQNEKSNEKSHEKKNKKKKNKEPKESKEREGPILPYPTISDPLLPNERSPPTSPSRLPPQPSIFSSVSLPTNPANGSGSNSSSSQVSPRGVRSKFSSLIKPFNRPK